MIDARGGDYLSAALTARTEWSTQGDCPGFGGRPCLLLDRSSRGRVPKIKNLSMAAKSHGAHERKAACINAQKKRITTHASTLSHL
jgi:hypothetical protein